LEPKTPALERAKKIHALDVAAAVTGEYWNNLIKF
jgi:hypothetical protein